MHAALKRLSINRWKRTNPAHRDGKGCPAVALLPVELIIHILNYLALPERSYHDISHWGECVRLSDLCSAAQTCWLWAHCAQTILFRDVVISSRDRCDRLNWALDPRKARGGHLGNMIVRLHINPKVEPPQSSQTPRTVSTRQPKPRPNTLALEQLIQHCPRLESLEIYNVYHPYTLGLSFSPSFTLPPTLRHLTIALTEWMSCLYGHVIHPTAFTVQLIMRAPWIKTLHLNIEYVRHQSPSLLPRDCLPPTYQLDAFKASQYDDLCRWVLQYSGETLRELELENASNLAEIAKKFPNITKLKFYAIQEGESLRDFTNLETLHYWADTRVTGCSFVHHLPPSIRDIKFRCPSMIQPFTEVMEGGTLPALRSIMFEHPKTGAERRIHPWGAA